MDGALSSCGVEELAQHLSGAKVIFHVAAKAGVWGSLESYWSINVKGTERLLQAAKVAKVPHFIYTSSPSADGLRILHLYHLSYLTIH